MITVLFQTASHYPVDRKKIKDALTRALEHQVTGDTEVSVTIVGDRQMRKLNKQYRQKDYPTDVLSFGFADPTVSGGSPFVDSPDDVLRLGEIVISYPQAVKVAREEDKMVDDTIVGLALHGLDHLMGKHHPE
jgi:probable rRNA maturation factor